MKYRELIESPMADFETFGDMSREGSFRPDDLKAINNPKWKAKVVKAFEKVPYPVNLYLINGDENGKVRYEVGKVGFDKYYARDLANLGQWAGVRSPKFVENMTRKLVNRKNHFHEKSCRRCSLASDTLDGGS
jgi:hypothetical protein